MWLDDIGESHFGTVHWLGIIDETRDKEWTVGVEFVSISYILIYYLVVHYSFWKFIP